MVATNDIVCGIDCREVDFFTRYRNVHFFFSIVKVASVAADDKLLLWESLLSMPLLVEL